MTEPIGPLKSTYHSPEVPKVTTEDVSNLHSTLASIDALSQAHDVAVVARKLQTTAQTPAQNETINNYINILKEALSLLRKDGLPVDFLAKELAQYQVGLPEYPPNAITVLQGMLHQVAEAAALLPPEEAGSFISTLKSSFQDAIPAAQKALPALQSDLNNIEKELTPQKYPLFNNLQSIMSYIQNLSPNPRHSDNFSKLYGMIVGLSEMYQGTTDPTQKKIIDQVFTALSKISSDGYSLADAFGTALFLQTFQAKVVSTLGSPDKEVAYMKELVDNMDPENPFMSEVKKKMESMQSQMPLMQYLQISHDITRKPHYVLQKNYWQTMINTIQNFDPNTITDAVNSVQGLLSNYVASSKDPLMQEYHSALQAFDRINSSIQGFTKAANGDLKDAFPNGVPLPSQDTTTPSILDQGIETEVAILEKAILAAPDPTGTLQTSLSLLLELTSNGPPFPANAINQLDTIAQTVNALAPFTADQKKDFDDAATSIGNQIATIQKEQASESSQLSYNKSVETAMQGLKNLADKLGTKGASSLTDSDWNQLLETLQKLYSIYNKQSNVNVQFVINKLFTTFKNLNGQVSVDLGHLLFFTELSKYNGKSADDAKTAMQSFVNNFPSQPGSSLTAYIRGALQADLKTWGGNQFSIVNGNIQINSNYPSAMTEDMNQHIDARTTANFVRNIQYSFSDFQNYCIDQLQAQMNQNAADISNLQNMEALLKQYG